MERESNIFGTLLFEWQFSENFAQWFEDVGMWLSVAAAAWVLVVNAVAFRNRHRYQESPWRYVERALLIFCVGWEFLLAASVTYRGGEPFSQWCVGAHGLRIGVPLALVLWNLRSRISPGMLRILRLATSFTFFVHGLQAYFKSPRFTTMLIGSGYLIGLDLDQSAVESLLTAIGVVDIVVAVLLLATRWRWVALYMAIWGVTTALGRMTAGGWSLFPETLLRLVHAGGPLFLFLEWSKLATRRETYSACDSDHDKFGESDAVVHSRNTTRE